MLAALADDGAAFLSRHQTRAQHAGACRQGAGADPAGTLGTPPAGAATGTAVPARVPDRYRTEAGVAVAGVSGVNPEPSIE